MNWNVNTKIIVIFKMLILVKQKKVKYKKKEF